MSKMEIYEKDNEALTQCYFCGEELIQSQLELHVKHCGLVLEPCPDNCGLYVQRQYKTQHANWCKQEPHHVTNTLQTLRTDVDTLRSNLEVELKLKHQHQADWIYQVSKFNQRLQRVEELNNKVISALTSFKKLISDEREARIKDFNEIKTNLVSVCKLAAQLKFSIRQTQIDISEMKNTYNIPERDNKFYEDFEAWKCRQELHVASLKLKVDKELNEEIYKLHKANIIRSKSVSDLLDLNEIIIDEQDRYSEQMKLWQQDIDRFKTFLNEENIMISGVWRDQLDEIKKLKSNIDKCDNTIKQFESDQTLLKEKIENLQPKYEISQMFSGKEKIEEIMKSLIDEGELIKIKIKDLEAKFETLKPNNESNKSEINDLITRDQDEIKSRLTHVENVLKGQTVTLKLPDRKTENYEKKSEVANYHKEDENEQFLKRPEKISNSENQEPIVISKREFQNLERLKPSTSVAAFESGRVTWTISNFAENMKVAKESDEELQGPIFYSNEFGYKFQLRACLNGVGQWKGRHLIVSLFVMKSEWDALLKWPCRIHVVICLVDQVAIPRKAKDIVKSFTSSPINRQSDYKCLQMFIPHRTLAEHSYIKADAVILKVKLKVISV